MLKLFKGQKAKRFRVDRLYHVFSDADPASLSRLRGEAELAVYHRPKDALAYAALACALVASVRAGLTDDLDEDAELAQAAAVQALHLAPRDASVMALCAPALALRDPAQAQDLLAQAARTLRRLPAALQVATQEGSRRPAL